MQNNKGVSTTYKAVMLFAVVALVDLVTFAMIAGADREAQARWADRLDVLALAVVGVTAAIVLIAAGVVYLVSRK